MNWNLYKINTERRGGIAMKKILTVLVLCTLMFTDCGKSDIAKTYNQSEKDGILITYYEKAAQVSQYELTLHKDSNWKII